MLRYVLRRLLLAIPTMLTIITRLFFSSAAWTAARWTATASCRRKSKPT